MKILRCILPIIILIVSYSGAKWMLTNKKEPKRYPLQKNTLTVDAMPFRRQNYQVILSSYGVVEPHTKTTLIPEVSGKIIQVSPNFQGGAFVEQGEMLLMIDPRDYEATVKIAQAEVIAAQFSLEQERNRIKDYEMELAIVQSEIAQARLALSQEKAKVAQAKIDWERLNPRKIPDDLVLRKPQLVAVVAMLDAGIAKAERIKRNIAIAPQQLTVVEYSLAAVKARLDREKLNLERTYIRAPYSGRILETSVAIGQYVSLGSVIAEIYTIDYVKVRLPLSANQLHFIKLPDENNFLSPSGVTFRPTAMEKSKTHWQGMIMHSEGIIDTQTQQLFAVAQINAPYRKGNHGKKSLRIGQFLQAEIQGIILEDVIVVPQAAIQQNQEIIVIDKEKHLFRKKIHLVWSDKNQAVIDNRFGDGELLCLTAISFSVDGTKVRVRIDKEHLYSK